MREIETLKGWIAHWREDTAAGLPCTEESLADAERAIERLQTVPKEMPGRLRRVNPRPERYARAALAHEAASLIDAMVEVLDDCRAYFDNRSDVSDGDYGIPEANEEMRMVARIDAVLPPA